MAPGGSNYQDIGDSRSAFADYGIAPESAEFKNSPFRKSAAVIGGKHGAGSNSAVHELLECPVCMNPMYPPIHQCPNGHTLCVKCKSKVHVCPICRHELGNIRCLALEKIAESLELPCRYQIYGCQDIFTYHTRLRHEQNCRFRPYNCPYAGSECAVTGDIQYLVAHLKDDHKVDMHDGCTFNHRYVKSNPQEVENATWMLTVFNCFGHQFCLHFEAFNLGLAPVYMAFLRFMGDDDDAKRFSYSLEVGGFGRKLTWQGVPRSIRDSHKTVRDSLDGLIIQRSMALFFSGGDRKELKLKNEHDFWTSKSTGDCSWYWKTLHKMKLKMKAWYNDGKYCLIGNVMYSISLRYEKLKGSEQKLKIVELLWNRVAVPKHRFINWLAVKGRFLTKDRMQVMGLGVRDTDCCLCKSMNLETAEHLLFFWFPIGVQNPWSFN